jgi:hypothetical protein
MAHILQRVLVIAAASAMLAGAQTAARKFYADDPILVAPETGNVTKPAPRKIEAMFDFLYQSFRDRPAKTVPSEAVNTLGEVPDSGWYVNRHSTTKRMTLDQLRRGPGNESAPVAPYQVIAGKTDGITPGFTVRDSKGKVFFVKPDPISNPEMATAADVIGAKFFYALGYNVPENYVLNFKVSELSIGKEATVRGATGQKRTMSANDLAVILEHVPQDKEGRLRVVASLRLPGEAIGPFRYEGTRTDDPNDLVPHERRRDLRGLNVFAAWLNHTDAKAGNSLDTVVRDGGRAFIRHHLIDFGAMLGSDSDTAKNARFGNEFIFPTGRDTLAGIFKFGADPKPWETVSYPADKAIGRFEATLFDPEKWTSNYPNPAFLNRRADDEFWAAKKVMAFTDDEIKVIVETGEFTDPSVVIYLTRTLAARRDKIGQAYFKKVLALDEFRLEGGQLRWEDLLVRHGFGTARQFQISWHRYDNATGQSTALANETSPRMPGDIGGAAPGNYFVAAINAVGESTRTVKVYIRKEAGGLTKIVGIDRTW